MQKLLETFSYTIEDLTELLNNNFDRKNYSREDIEANMKLNFEFLVRDIEWVGGMVQGIFFVNIWQ